MPSSSSRSSRLVARRASIVALALGFALALAGLAGGRASAQGSGAAPPPAAEPAPPPPAPAADAPPPPPTPTPTTRAEPVLPVAQPPAPARGGAVVTYHSPMRPMCEDELAKDTDWFDNLKTRLTDKINRDVHKDAANYATANNKHVIIAYAVFWVFTVVFVLMMWRRQRALQAELTRLEGDLARALKEGGAA